MQIYYINLDRRTDRRSEMEVQFQRLGLTAERISAVTPPDLSEAQKARSCDPRNWHWMTEVELCCSLSHVRALERFLADGGDYGVVLEDDVVLSTSLPAFLDAWPQQATSGLLRLETDLNGQRLMPKPDRVIDGIEIRRSWSWAAGSAAYVVSRSTAKTILDSEELLRLQADGALFNPYEILGTRTGMRHCLPALAVQSDRLDINRRDSDIALARNEHKKPIPLPWPQRAFRTLAGIAKTEIVMGSQRQFHTLLGGARKVPVPFKAN